MDFQKTFNLEVEMLCNEHLGNVDYAKEYLLNPGKHIRPSLFLDYAQTCSPILEKHCKIACAIELFHLALIIHDDVMDDDQMRRDVQTINSFYAKELGKLKGNGIAIVVGDLALSRALKLFAENLQNPESLRLVFEIMDMTGQGQLTQHLLNPMEFPSIEEILDSYERTTALYSIFLPLALGFYECFGENCPENLLRKLRDFSSHLGIAFKIFDDLMEFNLEKRRLEDVNQCSDIMSARATPILSFILERTEEATYSKWFEEWRKNQLSQASHDQIMAMGKQMGVVEYTEKLIAEHASKAWELIDDLGVENLPTVKFLQNLLKKNL